MEDVSLHAQLANQKSTIIRMQAAINKFCEKNEWTSPSYKSEGYVAALFSLRNQEHTETLAPVYRFAKMTREEKKELVRKYGRVLQRPTFEEEIRLTWKGLRQLLDAIEQL